MCKESFILTQTILRSLDSSLYTNYNYSQICNEERRRRLPLILNHKSHVSKLRDNLLQEYYNQRLPLKWLSCVADVSMPTFDNHYTGSILLNHLIEQKASLFQTLFIENKQIDYHMWLQTSRIMYFGPQSDLKLSVGDVIIGQSWIKRYFKKSDRKVHYGLGKTIITGCGMPVVQFPSSDSIAIDLPDVEIRNYERNNDYIVNLSYPDYYKRMLNRYKSIDIKTLQYLKGTIHTDSQQSNYMNYHTRLADTNNQSKIRKVLKTQCSI